MAATGQSVVIDGDMVSGIYPDMLRSIAAKEQCRFVITGVPRARLERLFETGKADLLVAAQRAARRDEFGVFVPMVRSRAALISLDDADRPAFKSFQDLMDHKETRLVVVRGYDYGAGYQELLDTLSRDNRVIFEADPRRLAGCSNPTPAMSPSCAPSCTAPCRNDPRMPGSARQAPVEPLDNLIHRLTHRDG